MRLIKAALPYLRQSDSASVLTVTSYSVKQPIVNLVLSNSIRSATVGLDQIAGARTRQGWHPLQFDSPAWTETERVTELMTARARANGTTVEEELAKQARESPFGRMASPEEFGQRGPSSCFSPAASLPDGRDAFCRWRNVQGRILIVGNCLPSP